MADARKLFLTMPDAINNDISFGRTNKAFGIGGLEKFFCLNNCEISDSTINKINVL